ncbi:sensor histidine kinase [Romeria aff. gracilis LEGE 07310]|uniref:histidine kinase n=1 Tax=Vasconcelosia minhoensis LEGE 07310 TaxID=915328 RepID=A0A8J7ANW4_9CYAN|nr:HAMP domain-containing sensor histidine kinase [Romeria gracilis]MBE9078555.1 sensor histidine kinase [Romeria aff. gracilis LEGE 07310]
MFQTTRRRLALWYTAVTAVLLLLFASGVYFYVRTTLIERVDDTLNHVVEVVQRSLVIEPGEPGSRVLTAVGGLEPPLRVNVADSFRSSTASAEDDHIDLEWFAPTGERLWTTFSQPPALPLHLNPDGETVHLSKQRVLRQVTQRIQSGNQILGYLRVSHPWFEVTKPSQKLIVDLGIGIGLGIMTVAFIGWLLSGLAIAPVRDSYQQLKQFTADASHELRNPIAVIQTNVQVALSDPEPDAQFQHSQLQVIERLTRRLGRLVDDLLFLARQESGLVPLQPGPVRLAQLLAEVVEEQQALAQEKNLTLKITRAANDTSSTGDWTVIGDRDQLTRLLTNLVANALQYTPTEGTVTVRLEPAKHQGHPSCRVTVQDTGIGIAPEELAQVFNRFYRADPARSRRAAAGGSGLGLAIAKVITDNHQGQITLSSQPNQGTTATVLLPTKKSPTP